MKRTVRILAVPATILLLAACGSTDEATEAPTIEQDTTVSDDGGQEATEPVEAPEIAAEADAEDPANVVTGPGVYQAPLMSGGTATVAVPGTGPEDLEQFRKDAGVDPVGYLVVEVDNTEGDSEALVFEAEVVDSEGETYTYGELTTSTYDWLGSSASIEMSDRQMELWDKYPYSTRPSAKNTVPLVGPEVPEDIVSVFVEYEQAEKVGDL